MAMLFSEPIAMKHGRGAMHFFTLACEFLGTPRSYGHASISMTAYVFDGGMKEPLASYMMARHDFAYEGNHDFGEEADKLQNSDLVFSARCASHVASCAVNHGLDILRTGPETNKVAHIVIASVRQGVTALQDWAPDFVLRHVEFCEEPSGSPEEIAIFWRMLGVEEPFIDEFVLLDPRWKGNSLLISARLESDADSLCRTARLLMYVLHFEDYVSTRWCGVGNAMRLYLRARAMGLSGLVAFCKERKVCQFHLAGYEQLVPSVAGFMAVAALGAYPAEAFLKEVLTDDRILRRMGEFRAALSEETSYLANLPPYVWSRLTDYVEGSYSAVELRDLTMKCAMISGAYIEKETLGPLDREPFTLAQGDIRGKLERLACAAPPSSDPVTRKVQFLLHAGYESTDRMGRAFQMLQDMPFSVHMVEQAHGLGACLMKFHERYGESLLRARGIICQAKPLFVADPDDRYELRLRNRLASLQAELNSATPGRGNGIRAFVSFFAKTAEGRALAASQGSGGRRVVARASALYAQLSTQEQAKWDAREKARAGAAKEFALDETEEVNRKLGICERRKKWDLLCNGLVNQVRSCRYSRERQQAIADAFQDLGHQDGIVSRLRNRAFCSPVAPTGAEQELIMDRAQIFQTPAGALPWLVPHICRNRDRFQGVALTTGSPAADVAYLLLYAHQRPFEAMFLELRNRRLVLPVPHRRAMGSDGFGRTVVYDCMPVRYIDSMDLPIGDDDEVFVSPGVVFEGDLAVCTTLDLRYEDFIWLHPLTQKMGAPQRKRKRPAQVTDDAKAEVMKEFPWLRPEDFGMGRVTKKKLAARKPRGEDPQPHRGETAEEQETERCLPDSSADPSSDEEEDGTEEEEVDAAEELAALRQEWDFEEGWEMAFYTRILGGNWTKANKGVVADGVLATGRASTRDWCKAFGWPNSRTFFFSKFGREAAHKLAEEWCRRADHYYRLFVEDECEDGAKFRYCEEYLESYEEDLEWVSWLLEQDENGKVWAAAHEIRAMRPAAFPGAQHKRKR